MTISVLRAAPSGLPGSERSREPVGPRSSPGVPGDGPPTTAFEEPATGLAGLSDDALAEQIVSWSGRLAAGEARLLDLVAEFDRREAWGGPGLLSCAHWLQWRVGLSPGAAREKVRVARRLQELTVVREALRAGRLSYSQARAVTRAASVHDQQVWVDMAAHSTAGQLERLSRGVRRVRRTEQDARDPEAAQYRMRASKRYDEDGTAVYTLRLPPEQAAVLDAALEQVRVDLGQERRRSADAADGQREDDRALGRSASGSGETDVSAETPVRASLADALVAMAGQVLQQAGPVVARRARAALTVQVDPLSGWARLRDGEVLPPSTVLRVLSAQPAEDRSQVVRPLTDTDLRQHDSGRERRRPSSALRDLLGTVDGERCRYPGCTRHRRLHAHHVHRWSEGGGTDLDNLLLLCPRHHTLVHADGTRLVLAADRRLEVTTAAGVRVPHLPRPVWGQAEQLPDVSAETSAAVFVDRLDLGYAVAVLVQQAA